MKSNCLVTLCALAVLVIMATADSTKYDVSKASDLFEQFIKDYQRVYKDETDKQIHFEAFKNSLMTSNRLNAEDPSATYGINKFADYTEDEKKYLFGRKK